MPKDVNPFLRDLYEKTKEKIFPTSSKPSKKNMEKPKWEFDYGKTSKNLIEHGPIKNLFNEMFELLNKDFYNTVAHGRDTVQTKHIERKMNELLNHELMQNYIQSNSLPEHEFNKLFVLFLDKVLTNFVSLKTQNPERYPKDHIEKLTAYLSELNDIWKSKTKKIFEMKK